jgi:exportin-1
MASDVLTQFKEHPQAWTRVDVILEQAQSQHTKFFALSVLEDLIKYRWKILPAEQQVAIRGVVVHLILKFSADEASMKVNRLALKKLNQVLVQILKHEWPHRWESFIPDLISSSRTSESLCENNMHILQLLSEEIFEFSHGEMTKAKTRSLKTTLNKEFSMIFNLCSFVLENLESERLLAVTLQTLHRFLCWIPLGFIFETKLLNGLLYKVVFCCMCCFCCFLHSWPSQICLQVSLSLSPCALLSVRILFCAAHLISFGSLIGVLCFLFS